MGGNILKTIKKMLGYDPDGSDFDVDILIHINDVFATLTELNVGPAGGFAVSELSDWLDFSTDVQVLQHVKTYVYCKVKIVFDPPASSSHLESLKNISAEEEQRLLILCDV